MTDLGSYEDTIRGAKTAGELDTLELQLFGRKQGMLTALMKELSTLPPAERVKKGQELNAHKQKLEGALAQRRRTLASQSHGSLATEDRMDVTIELPKEPEGHLHPIPEFIRQVEEVFGRMGFELADGPEIETEENNFDLLNIPQNHPARDAQDTFWITDQSANLPPSKKYVLRTHTSGVQIRYASKHKPPFRIIYHGKTYRKDADATHSPMFHQFECMMVGKDISLANMKAVLIAAIKELVSPNVEFRFRTGFFPFVEPGLEVDLRWQGDDAQSREGKWLEIAGCGMVHPNILKNCGIDPEEWQGFAAGFGVERMLMIKHQIPDLRSFFVGDVRFLRQFH